MLAICSRVLGQWLNGFQLVRMSQAGRLRVLFGASDGRFGTGTALCKPVNVMTGGYGSSRERSLRRRYVWIFVSLEALEASNARKPGSSFTTMWRQSLATDPSRVASILLPTWLPTQTFVELAL